MLQIWLDESGRGQKPAFVLAGWFSSEEAWVEFSREWQKLLRNPPSLRRLKAYEAFGLQGEFRGWTETDRDGRLLEFVQLIQRYSGMGIAFVIEQIGFEKIVKPAADSPFRSPQTLAYFLSLVSILPIVQDSFGSSERIDIVFDSNLVGRKHAETAYRELHTRAPDLAALLVRKEPRFEADEMFPPLQAADLLAHWYARVLRSGFQIWPCEKIPRLRGIASDEDSHCVHRR
jgi:hypothetical protein